MKARWLITVLLAFPFAFAFFLREARLGEKRAARPVLVVAPPLAPAVAVSATPTKPARAPDISPVGPMSPIGPISENPGPDLHQPSSSIENRESKIQNPPTLLTGTFTNEDASLIYDADAKLRLSKDVILSSPTGVMVSNEKQTLFAGDMQIESGKNIITAHEGVLDTTTSQMKATVASISFTNENNQMVRMTGENVTLELPSQSSPASPGKVTGSSLKLTFPPAHVPPPPETSQAR